jgi:Ham1 family protein
MKKVLFATGNESKGKRFQKGLLENGIEILTLNDIDKKIEIEETGKDGVENALIKARSYAEAVDMPVFAMDDNLYIEGIPAELQPGTCVRRINGKRLNDSEMLDYYTNLVNTYSKDGKLNCRWVYGIAVINNGKESTYSWSLDDFYLVSEKTTKIKKDYPLDSISIDKRNNKYFADITDSEKKEIKRDESDVLNFLINHLK